MAKRVSKSTQKASNEDKSGSKVPQSKATKQQSNNPKKETPAQRKKRVALENLKKASGFDKNPQNINRSGANKGSRWNKSLLKELMTMELNGDELKQYETLKELFPKQFSQTETKNFQLFMELRQMQLVFSPNGQISQKAITEIRDRLDGKPVQQIKQETTHYVDDSEDGVKSWLDEFFGEVDEEETDNM